MQRKSSIFEKILLLASCAVIFQPAAALAEIDPAVLNILQRAACEGPIARRFAGGLLSPGNEIYLKEIFFLPGDIAVYLMFGAGVAQKLSMCGTPPGGGLSLVISALAWTIVALKLRSWLKKD